MLQIQKNDSALLAAVKNDTPTGYCVPPLVVCCLEWNRPQGFAEYQSPLATLVLPVQPIYATELTTPEQFSFFSPLLPVIPFIANR